MPRGAMAVPRCLVPLCLLFLDARVVFGVDIIFYCHDKNEDKNYYLYFVLLLIIMNHY